MRSHEHICRVGTIQAPPCCAVFSCRTGRDSVASSYSCMCNAPGKLRSFRVEEYVHLHGAFTSALIMVIPRARILKDHKQL